METVTPTTTEVLACLEQHLTGCVDHSQERCNPWLGCSESMPEAYSYEQGKLHAFQAIQRLLRTLKEL